MDDNIILSYGVGQVSKVLSDDGDGFVYEVKDRTITRKVVLSDTELIAAIDQWITANS